MNDSSAKPETMNEAQVWSFFDSKPGWAALTTIDGDGYPHTVAIGYFRLQNKIYCACRPNTVKTRNIEREPKVSLMLENGRSNGSEPRPLMGVLFQGKAKIVASAEERLQIKSTLALQRGQQPPTSVADNFVYIEIEVAKIRSWLRAAH